MKMGVPKDIIILILIFLPPIIGFPDQGIWTKSYKKVYSAFPGIYKSLYAGSSISVTVNCEPYDAQEKVFVEIGWLLRQASCYEEYLSVDILNQNTLRMLYDCPMSALGVTKVKFKKSAPIQVECSSALHLEFVNLTLVSDKDDLPVNQACPTRIPTENFGTTAEKVDSLAEIKMDKKQLSDIAYANVHENDSKSDREGISMHNIKKREDSDGVLSATNQSATKVKSNGNTNIIRHFDNMNLTNVPVPSDSMAAFQVPYNIGAPYHDVHSIVKQSGSKIATVDADGVYLFILKVASKTSYINFTVGVSIKGEYGYLSAADYPLVIFYAYMCGVYVIYAVAWLVVSACQWRDLLRVQFWISGVIVLGLTEKAVFYAEYQSINYTGKSVQGAVIFAEILSCMKRTLARMLVIIVSLGFGIVKPRLGSMLHRVVGIGALYFVLATTEGCLRVLKPKNDPSNQALMASVPLAIIDSVICWWIFSSLVQTNRTLRLRRNLVKLTLYRHFTNTLIFAVLASVTYMIWSIHSHKLVACIKDWKELWIDEAYWHLLFSLILLVIMILWRPTNNNQRYAYTPLLDALDDDNEDDFDQNLANDAFIGMKMRASKNPIPEREKEVDAKQDDDLKWVEENVPSTFTETAVPSFMDSDEEIMTAKFERNKME